MGKRSNFPKIGKDKYNTPARAVWPLLAHLEPGATYAEPCAGRGDLIRHLSDDGFECRYASDIAPHNRFSPLQIEKRDFRKVTAAMLRNCDLVITNPPWTREVLHPLVEHFLALKAAWYLWDADWLHNTESSRLVKRSAKIVSIGRVKWFPGSESAGKENCMWIFFPQNHFDGPKFVGRKG